MSIVVDFIGYLASVAWLSGNAISEGKTRQKIEKRTRELELETDLFLAFRDGDGGRVSVSLGRPYRHVFPQYLRRQLENKGATWQEIRKAEDEWLAKSETGITMYISMRDKRPYNPVNPEYTSDAFLLGKKQEKYMSWYREAMEKFPHYAVRNIYIEQYPGRQSYFNAIEAYRRKDYPDLEPIFGVSPPSDDPEYDAKVRRLFYAIDADGSYGLTLEDRYNVMRFLQFYRYHGNNWQETMKFYTALNRILAAEGVDQNDYLEGPCEVAPLHGQIMNIWRTRETRLPFPEKLEKIRELITRETEWMDKGVRYRRRVLYAMAIQTLLRRDGLDPELYPVEPPKKKKR